MTLQHFSLPGARLYRFYRMAWRSMHTYQPLQDLENHHRLDQFFPCLSIPSYRWASILQKVFPGVFVVASWLELMLDATSSLSRDYKSAKCLQGELSGYLVKKSQNFIRMLPCPLANLVLRKRLDFLGHVFSCGVQDVRTVDVIYLHWLTLALVSCLTAWLNSTIMKTLSCSVSSVKHFILLFPVSNRDFL